MSLPLVVGITGASGVIYGVEMLRVLKRLGVQTHLVMSDAACINLAVETEYSNEDVKALATAVYDHEEIDAPIASGSFQTSGMIVAPCSIKTLSAIANSYSCNLMTRAADVMLKERRTLVLMVRETPLHKGHLDLMSRAADYGAVILPPMPAFYHKPESLMDIIHHSIGKALDQFGIEHNLFSRWDGNKSLA